MRGMIWSGVIFVIVVFFWSARYYYQQSISWQEKAKEANASAREYKIEVKLLQSQQLKLAELDYYHTEKLNEAEQENAALRTQLARGHRRLLISGQKYCPDRTFTPTSGMVDDGTIELSTDTGQHIFSIREGIFRDQQKLMYLQSYIRQFCLQH